MRMAMISLGLLGLLTLFLPSSEYRSYSPLECPIANESLNLAKVVSLLPGTYEKYFPYRTARRIRRFGSI